MSEVWIVLTVGGIAALIIMAFAATHAVYGDIGPAIPGKKKNESFDASNASYEALKVSYDELLDYATLLRGAIEGIRWSNDPNKVLRETYHVVFDTTPMDRVGNWRHRQLKMMNRHNMVDMKEVEQMMAQEMYERRTSSRT